MLRARIVFRREKITAQGEGILSYRLAIWLAVGLASCTLPARQGTSQSTSTVDQQQNASESEASLIAKSKIEPTNPEPLARLGLLEARRGHYSEAIAFYRRAMALKPSMPGLRLNLGLALFKDGQYQPAIAIFTRLMKSEPLSSPEKPRLTVLLGMSHYGRGEYQAAIPYLKQAAESDSQNLALLLTLAHSCLLAREYPCVLDTYHRMIAQNAASAEADMLVGEALDEMNDASAATQEFRAAVQANPKEPNAHFGLGYLLWTQLQYQEAAQEFQAELENTPDYTTAMVYLADADIKLDRKDDARALLERVVKSDPAISMGHLDLGIVYAEAGQDADALRELKAAAALKPSDLNVHLRLGRLYRAMGKTSEATIEFNKARSVSKAKHDALLQVLSAGTPAQAQTTP